MVGTGPGPCVLRALPVTLLVLLKRGPWGTTVPCGRPGGGQRWPSRQQSCGQGRPVHSQMTSSKKGSFPRAAGWTRWDGYPGCPCPAPFPAPGLQSSGFLLPRTRPAPTLWVATGAPGCCSSRRIPSNPWCVFQALSVKASWWFLERRGFCWGALGKLSPGLSLGRMSWLRQAQGCGQQGWAGRKAQL